MEKKCSTKFCRGEHYLTLIGKPLCKLCFEKHCDEGETNGKRDGEIKQVFGTGDSKP